MMKYRIGDRVAYNGEECEVISFDDRTAHYCLSCASHSITVHESELRDIRELDTPILLPCGALKQHTVFKDEDIKKCPPYMQENLRIVINHIKAIRRSEGRDMNPTYLVINTDESYIDEVIDVLKRNGDWGPKDR